MLRTLADYFLRFFTSKSDAVFTPCPPKSPSITREDFAQLLIDQAGKIKPGIEIVFDSQEFSLKILSQEQQLMYLHNAYLEYSQVAEEDRPAILKKWLRHFLFLKTMPEDWEDVVPDLLPALRNRSYFELAELRFREQGRDFARFSYQDVGDHYALAVSYDMHDSIVMISDRHLEDWGITFFEAMEIAMRNLLEKECVFTCLKLEEKMFVYCASSGDGFDGTRLVLLEQIRKLRVHGDYIAMVLNTDSLLITGSEDQLGLGFFLSQAMEGSQKPHALPPFLLRLEGEEWVPWLPPETNPLYKPFLKFRILAIATDYAQQQELLGGIYEKEENGPAVAGFFAAEREPAGTLLTYTLWGKGCEALLPQAEFVGFVEEGRRQPVFIPWKIVRAVVGDLMRPLEDYPPRFLVREYPSEKEMTEMLARAES